MGRINVTFTIFGEPCARAVFLFGCGCCVLVVFGFVCLVPVFCSAVGVYLILIENASR